MNAQPERTAPTTITNHKGFWNCSQCTYQHESPDEQLFLVCSLCHTPKPSDVVSACLQPPVTTTKMRSATKSTARPRTVQQNEISIEKTEEAATKPTTKSTEVHVTPPSTTTTTRKRSLHDALRPQPASSFVPRPRVRYFYSSTTTNNNKNKNSTQEDSTTNQKKTSPKATRNGTTATGEWRDVTDTELSELCPLTIARDVLPKNLATSLLQHLEQESMHWNRGNWILHGKEHTLPRTTAMYSLLDKEEQKATPNHTESNGNHTKESHPRKQHTDKATTGTAAKVAADPILYQPQPNPPPPGGGEVSSPASLSSSLEPSLLQQAAQCIITTVQTLRPWMVDWKPTFCLANRYVNGTEGVSWHSDHITTLGPRPIIVGLSLGAGRRFELRQQQPQLQSQPQSPLTQQPQSRSAHHGGGNPPAPPRLSSSSLLLHASVPAPHNSAIVMWNDAQESWHHAVPRCGSDAIVPHPQVGLVRLSLTFRQEQPRPNSTLGLCYCGRPAGLKAKQGQYFIMCQPFGSDKHQTCGYWKPCAWANAKAAQLKRREEEQHDQQRQQQQHGNGNGNGASTALITNTNHTEATTEFSLSCT
jgi:2OG-Fe(II) oxygenase superfamily